MTALTLLLIWTPASGVQPARGLTVSRQPDRATADAELEKLANDPAKPDGRVVQIAQDLTMTGPTLIQLHNELTGENVKRFETATVGRNRFFTALTARYADAAMSVTSTPKAEPVPAAVTSETNDEENTEMAAKKKTAPKTIKKSGRRSRFSDDQIIHIIHKENPHGKGTWGAKQYALYKNGMTIGKAREEGAKSAYIGWDVDRGHIKVTNK